MRKTVWLLMLCSTLLLLPGIAISQESFDGNWNTKMSCPPKGNTQGYTWEFPSTIQNGNLHGEHGKAGEPGYLLIEGAIKADGSAKLAANGIVASRKYARGILAHQGADYSYNIKSQFKGTTGSGVRDQGLGIEGRPCTFDFTKQAATTSPADQK